MQKKMRSGAIPLSCVGLLNDSGNKSIARHSCANFGRQYNANIDIATTPFEDADPLMTELMRGTRAITVNELGREGDLNDAVSHISSENLHGLAQRWRGRSERRHCVTFVRRQLHNQVRSEG